ncbi:MAG: aldo/keto reductase [Marinilabiliales bacterium]|nr:aldo/keto reductase [Marinilabiliales bacterium]
MLYRRFGKTNEQVSLLGFGCMRLPLHPGGVYANIDVEASSRLIRYAIDEGVNYIDTAYPYHGTGMSSAGQSEPVVGRILRDGYREKVKLATKLPSWLVQTRKDMDKFLDEQLRRLETDHIDFYLVHALNKSLWANVKRLGIADFLENAIGDGRIRYAGFSYHDEPENFQAIVDGFDWSFCQIQYNYMDEEFQAGRKGLEYAGQKDLGITIMEPLRGGKLAQDLPESVQAAFHKAERQRKPADWALSWIWNHPETSVLISGMNSMEQVKENIQSACDATPDSFTAADEEVIGRVKSLYRQRIKVDCTACGYCMPCPSGVDIPGCFGYFNNLHMYGKEDNYRFLKPGERASACTECGACEEHCPQCLPIPELLKEVRSVFEPA